MFPGNTADEAARTAQKIVELVDLQSAGLERDLDGEVHIAISPLLNRSTAPDHTTDLLSDRMAATIRNAGKSRGFVFRTPLEQADPAGQVLPCPYILYGEVFAIRKNDVRYWEIFYALDRIDPTGQSPRRKVWDSRQGFLIRR